MEAPARLPRVGRMPWHPPAANKKEGAVHIQPRWTARGTAAAAALAAAMALTGCSSLTAEDLKTMLGGVTQVAQAAGEYEAARRAGRSGPGSSSNFAQGANAGSAQPGATAAYAAEPAAYAALSCVRVTQRGGAVCMENGCGNVVMLYARSGAGAFGPVALAPGTCAPVIPGTVAAVACRPGDRFDWQRAACLGS